METLQTQGPIYAQSFTHMYMCICMLYNRFCSSEELWLVLAVQNSLCSRISASLHGNDSTWPVKSGVSPQCSLHQGLLWGVWAKTVLRSQFLYKGRECVCCLCVPFSSASSRSVFGNSLIFCPRVLVGFNRESFV